MDSNKIKSNRTSKNSRISSLLAGLIAKDTTTATHLNITAEIMEEFAKFLGLKETKIEELKLFAKFHDIGKAGIPNIILLKKGKLTLEEFNEIKRHSEIGYKLTKFVPSLTFASGWILCHHENWDGTGYPWKLTGTKIPLESRILALVDSYEAMTSDNRAYRRTKTKEYLTVIGFSK
jgi:HD-GYP domain-containing protein (c-di-GMP phosphodiesterase class II)